MNRTRAFFQNQGTFQFSKKGSCELPPSPTSCATVHSIKFFHYIIFYIKIYFYSVKVNLYSWKYVFIMPRLFHYIKIYFYSIKINLYSIRNIFIKHISFHSSKIFFYYMNFSFNISLVSISSFPFVLTKVRILLSACKLNSSTRV